MATITSASFDATNAGFLQLSSDTTRIYYDAGMAIDDEGEPTGDTSARTDFGGTFTDEVPFTLVTPAMSITTTDKVTMKNGTVVTTAGAAAFSLTTDYTFQGHCDVDIDNMNFMFSNGLVNGWGLAGNANASVTGSCTNSTFGNNGTTGNWFVNLVNATADFNFANNALTAAVLNTARAGNYIIGLQFAGTTRQQSSGNASYTIRINYFSTAGAGNWTMLMNNSFANDTAKPYAAGAGTAGVAHYETNGMPAGSEMLLINEQYEGDAYYITRRGGSAATFHSTYAWNPTFITPASATIVDAKLVGVGSDTVYQVPTGATNRELSFTEQYPTISDGFVTSSGNGLLVLAQSLLGDPTSQVSIEGTATRSFTDGSLLVTPVTKRAKSYTHLVDSVLTSQINDIENSGGATGSFSFTSEHATTADADAFILNGVTQTAVQAYDGSDATHNVGQAIYSRVKSDWYVEDSLNEAFSSTIDTSTGLTMSLTKPISFTNVAGPAAVTSTTVTVPATHASGIVADAIFNSITTTSTLTSDAAIDGFTTSSTVATLNGAVSNANITATTGSITTTAAVTDSTLSAPAGNITTSGVLTGCEVTVLNSAIIQQAVSGGSLTAGGIAFTTADGTSDNLTISSTGAVTLNASATYTDTNFTAATSLNINGAYSSGTTTGATLTNVNTTGITLMQDVANTTNSTLTQTSAATVDIIRGTTHTGTTFGAGVTFSPKFDTTFTGCTIAGTFQNQNINRILLTNCDITGTIGFSVVSASAGNNQGQVITGGSFSGTLTGTGGDTLTMTDVDVTGITLGSTGGTITPLGTTQLDILQAAGTASAGTWVINAPVVVISNTWTIPTPSSGRYAIRQNISGVDTQLVPATEFVAGSVVSGTISDDATAPNTFADGDSITIYVKYDSVFAAGSLQYYLENAQTFNFSTVQGTGHTFGVGSTEVASFAIDEQSDVPSNVSFAASADGNNTLVEITNSDSASLTLTFNTSLQLIADIANSSAYFDAWYANRGTTVAPIVNYGQGYVANIDASRITLESGNLSGGFRLQHTTGNWSNSSSTGTFASSRTGAPEVVSVIAGLALVNPTDIRNALDTSQVATDVTDIKNVAGYTVDPNSLGPLVNAYDSNTNYEDNI